MRTVIGGSTVFVIGSYEVLSRAASFVISESLQILTQSYLNACFLMIIQSKFIEEKTSVVSLHSLVAYLTVRGKCSPTILQCKRIVQVYDVYYEPS